MHSRRSAAWVALLSLAAGLGSAASAEGVLPRAVAPLEGPLVASEPKRIESHPLILLYDVRGLPE
jgi:hypothetical protein